MSGYFIENRAGLFGKPVKAHPGLNVNQIITVSSMQMSLLLFKRVVMRSVETSFLRKLQYANVSLTHSLPHSGVDTVVSSFSAIECG